MQDNKNVIKIIFDEECPEIKELLEAQGLAGQVYETDSLTGDPSTIALLMLASAEVVRAVGEVVSKLLDRNKSIEISSGDKTIKVQNCKDLESAITALNTLTESKAQGVKRAKDTEKKTTQG